MAVHRPLWRPAGGDVERDFWLAFDLLRSHKDHVEFTVVRDGVQQVGAAPRRQRTNKAAAVHTQLAAAGAAGQDTRMDSGGARCGSSMHGTRTADRTGPGGSGSKPQQAVQQASSVRTQLLLLLLPSLAGTGWRMRAGPGGCGQVGAEAGRCAAPVRQAVCPGADLELGSATACEHRLAPACGFACSPSAVLPNDC